MEMNQQRIKMVLNSRAIEFITVDIAAPGMQEMRKFMREKARKKEGQRNPLPPQIFNGEEYRGVGLVNCKDFNSFLSFQGL